MELKPLAKLGSLTPKEVNKILQTVISENNCLSISAGQIPYITAAALLGVSVAEPILTYVEDAKYIGLLSKSKYTKVIICPDYLLSNIEQLGKFAIVSENPKKLFFDLYNQIAVQRIKDKVPSFISPTAQVHPDATLAEHNVFIGENVLIEAGVVIHERVFVGDNSIIRSNSSIGASGFEHKRISNELISIIHDGQVWISDFVEVGPNSVIGQGFWGNNTSLGAGTKLDNLVSVAHSSKIGEKVLLGAGTVVSGSVQIEQNVYVGPGSTLTNSIKVGENSKIVLGSVVYRDVSPNSTVMGAPAREIPISK